MDRMSDQKAFDTANHKLLKMFHNYGTISII